MPFRDLPRVVRCLHAGRSYLITLKIKVSRMGYQHCNTFYLELELAPAVHYRDNG